MKIDWFNVVFGLITVVFIGLILLILVVVFDTYSKQNTVKAQYPDDFTAIIEQCGKQAASSIVVSGIAIKAFSSGAFLSCAAQHNVTFELNGDTVKAASNAD